MIENGEKRDILFNFKVSKSERELLQALADSQGTSISNIIRTALRQMLINAEKK